MSYDYVVLGLGKTGLSCVKHLQKIQASFAVTDSREVPPALEQFKALSPETPCSLGRFDFELMLQAKELVVSQGIDYEEPAIVACLEAGIPIIGDIELFARAVNAPVIAITGSNAKSTVTTLIGECFKTAGLNVQVGGNLGQPALDLLVETIPQYYILELSNFQLETTWTLTPTIATILNISPDHLDRYRHFEDYVAAKHRIYMGCNHIVVNRNDPLTLSHDGLNRRVISFGVDAPVNASDYGLITTSNGETYLALGKKALLPVNDLKIKGQHNWMNALVALAISHELGLPLSAILQTLRDFPGLAHRCQWVNTIKGTAWYNDSKGTNIGASIAAIEGLGESIQGKGKIILLAGGLGKGADFTLLKPVVEKYVKTLILYGQDGPIIGQALGESTIYSFFQTFEEAVHHAYHQGNEGDIVLLSPACASWDMFENFEHRGQVFCDLVNRLALDS